MVCIAGGVAQLGERLLCKQEVIGSIPFTSTILRCAASSSVVSAKRCGQRAIGEKHGLRVQQSRAWFFDK